MNLESGGVRLDCEVTGDRGPTILLLPTWTIVHRRFWKAQVPYLSRHFRVVTYDGPGNGLSDRPLDPSAYDHDVQARHALAVLDATGTDRAVVVGVSQGAQWGLQLAAEHRDRVLGSVFLGASVDLADGHPSRLAAGDPADLPPSRVPVLQPDPDEHWAKYDAVFWRDRYEDFLWFFFGQCFPEPHSTKQVEDCVAWGLETSADVLVAEAGGARPGRQLVERWCRAVAGPVLAVHGTLDRISPSSRGRRIAELTGGGYVELVGAGHLPHARDPVRVNLLVRDFVRRIAAS